MSQNLLLTSKIYHEFADKYHIRKYTWNTLLIPYLNVKSGFENYIKLNDYTIIFCECILKNDIITIFKAHIYILYGEHFNNLQTNLTHKNFKECFLNDSEICKNTIYYTFRITELGKVIRVFDQDNNIIEIEFNPKNWKYNIVSKEPFHYGKSHCEFFLKLFINYNST